jgi:hypothetical protein
LSESLRWNMLLEQQPREFCLRQGENTAATEWSGVFTGHAAGSYHAKGW